MGRRRERRGVGVGVGRRRRWGDGSLGGQVIAQAEVGVRRRWTMQMRACETGVVLQGCVSRTADARQSQSAGPADTLQPGFVAFARAASFSM